MIANNAVAHFRQVFIFLATSLKAFLSAVITPSPQRAAQEAPARLNVTVCRGWEHKRRGAYAETIRVPSLIQVCTHQPPKYHAISCFPSLASSKRVDCLHLNGKKQTGMQENGPPPACRPCVAPNASASRPKVSGSVERNHGFVTWLIRSISSSTIRINSLMRMSSVAAMRQSVSTLAFLRPFSIIARWLRAMPASPDKAS